MSKPWDRLTNHTGDRLITCKACARLRSQSPATRIPLTSPISTTMRSPMVIRETTRFGLLVQLSGRDGSRAPDDDHLSSMAILPVDDGLGRWAESYAVICTICILRQTSVGLGVISPCPALTRPLALQTSTLMLSMRRCKNRWISTWLRMIPTTHEISNQVDISIPACT